MWFPSDLWELIPGQSHAGQAGSGLLRIIPHLEMSCHHVKRGDFLIEQFCFALLSHLFSKCIWFIVVGL